MSTRTEATIEDLYAVEGKAEIVNGELVHMPPTGDVPSYAAGAIFVSLHTHARQAGSGRAVTDNAGFLADLPHRKSFSPDAAFYTGPPAGMKFFPQAPVFAVEVRSEGDYGPKAEREMAKKRADYFAAGTLVVWDVDLRSRGGRARLRRERPRAAAHLPPRRTGRRRTRRARLAHAG